MDKKLSFHLQAFNLSNVKGALAPKEPREQNISPLGF